MAPGVAGASQSEPSWLLHVRATPTYISESLGGNIVVLATNHGGAALDGSPTTIEDVVPAGLEVTGVSAEERPTSEEMACEELGQLIRCTSAAPLAADNEEGFVVDIKVRPTAGGATLLNHAAVEGGGAPGVASVTPVVIAAALPGFGLEDFGVELTEADGTPDVQAGSHPNSVTIGLHFNTVAVRGSAREANSVQPVRDISVNLPLGLLANAQSVPKCPEYDIAENGGGIHCPASSIIGTVVFRANRPKYIFSELGREEVPEVSPIYNVAPQRGYPAEFAFDFLQRAGIIYGSLAHTSDGYVLRGTTPGIPLVAEFSGVELTFFGDPAVHDGGSTPPAALFTTPVSCDAPGEATIESDSWAEPGVLLKATDTLPAMTGCDRLHFEPHLSLAPETTTADTPTGTAVTLTVPQNESPTGVASGDVKGVTMALPHGMTLSPSAADGLGSCAPSGPTGFGLYEEALGPDGQMHLTPGRCPASSQIGTVRVTTPLLSEPLLGHLFLATPPCGGAGAVCTDAIAESGALYTIYLEAQGSGVVIKLVGHVKTNAEDGDVTVVFPETPELPFSELVVTTTGGAYAPLATPASCAPGATETFFTSWNDSDTSSTWPFQPAGCPEPPPVGFGLSAGSTNPAAGGGGSFQVGLTREDGEQYLQAVDTVLPPGLLGRLSSVPVCGEPQAAGGSCPESARIGTSAASSGAGPHPYWFGGSVYLTGPYGGAPFGLSVVTPIVAGPFDFGSVVVRAGLFVDPETAVVTVKSGPLPQILEGVPTRLRAIHVTIDRPGFIVNPTNCSRHVVQATIHTTLGAAASASTPFAVNGCNALGFAPHLTAATSAHVSRTLGTSLVVRVAAPSSHEASIRSVKVDLPKALPSRLTTLHKACPAAVFATNPAHCPPGSRVGSAVAKTPLLSRPLVGPAYLVSHENEAFPNLVVALESEGIAVRLVGATTIKHGVTSSSFRALPDAPVTAFELKLPAGTGSLFAGFGNLCHESLAMPVRMTGANGAVDAFTSHIAPTGCPRVKAGSKRQR